jgi:flagellar basal-body rod protein FlgB
VFNDITTVTLTAAMRGGAMRQTVLAQNLANADTPGYRRLSVSFEGALATALATDRGALAAARRGTPGDLGTRPRALDSVMPAISREGGTVVRVDGSNVDPDNEMSELAANQLAYNTVTSLLNARFQQMRTVIAGR